MEPTPIVALKTTHLLSGLPTLHKVQFLSGLTTWWLQCFDENKRCVVWFPSVLTPWKTQSCGLTLTMEMPIEFRLTWILWWWLRYYPPLRLIDRWLALTMWLHLTETAAGVCCNKSKQRKHTSASFIGARVLENVCARRGNSRWSGPSLATHVDVYVNNCLPENGICHLVLVWEASRIFYWRCSSCVQTAVGFYVGPALS